MQNIFITGIAGFLGSHLAEELIRKGYRVYGNDILIGGDPENVPEGAEWYTGDIRGVNVMKETMKTWEIDTVYHCAALAYEGLSVFSPVLIAENILVGTTSVMSAAIQSKVKRIVFCSSMARYGNVAVPYKEDGPCEPVDPYGVSKLAAEGMLRSLGAVHGVEVCIAVPHNIIGPRQKYDDPYRNVASIMMNRMLQGKQPIIYGDGTQKRSFSFVNDCTDVLVKMGTTDSGVGEIVNIGPDGNEITILNLAEEIARQLDFPLDPIFLPGRPAEVKEAFCSSDKARRLFNYDPGTSLSTGIKEMAMWMKLKGPKPFFRHLPIEIESPLMPAIWKKGE